MVKKLKIEKAFHAHFDIFCDISFDFDIFSDISFDWENQGTLTTQVEKTCHIMSAALIIYFALASGTGEQQGWRTNVQNS